MFPNRPRVRDTSADMTGSARRWWFFVHACVVLSEKFPPKLSPCQGGSVIFGLVHTSSDNGLAGSVELMRTFPLIQISNGTVSYPYPWIRLNDTSVEVNFTKHQEVVLRELRKLYPNASNVGIFHHCALDRDLLCYVVCEFDEDELELYEDEEGSGTAQEGTPEEICGRRIGISTLKGSWGTIWRRWHNVCLDFERQKPIRVSVTFRHHAHEKEVWCNVSLSVPVRCKVRLYRGHDSLGSSPCEQYANGTVGALFGYKLERSGTLDGLTCHVISDMFEDTIVRLGDERTIATPTVIVPTTRAPSITVLTTGIPSVIATREDGTDGGLTENQTDRGPIIGLSVCLACVFVGAVATLIFAFRKRLGLRSLDRAVDRVFARVTYRRTATDE